MESSVKKKIIVSFTSWKKRIKYVSRSIYMMVTQTIQPDEIILNLSSDEFENLEKDLPTDLLLLKEMIPSFRINWVKENTKAFKKVIPIIKEYHNTDCWILSIDDDVFYKEDYIEFMIKNAEQNLGCYLSPGTWGNHPIGYAMIYDPKWFSNEKIWKYTKNDADRIVASDHWIWENLKENGIKLKLVKDIEKHIKLLNYNDPLHNTYSHINFNERQRYIECLLKRLS